MRSANPAFVDTDTTPVRRAEIDGEIQRWRLEDGREVIRAMDDFGASGWKLHPEPELRFCPDCRRDVATLAGVAPLVCQVCGESRLSAPRGAE